MCFVGEVDAEMARRVEEARREGVEEGKRQMEGEVHELEMGLQQERGRAAEVRARGLPLVYTMWQQRC